MSSGSESDDDYVPGEPEKLSEEESANEETDKQYENEKEKILQKRKLAQESKGKKKRKTRNGVTEIPDSPERVIAPPANPEEEKKKEDDLWAMFLEGTDTKPKAVAKETVSIASTKPTANKVDPPKKETSSNDDKAREQRIFEFAGETIVVENNKIKEKIKTSESPASGSKVDVPPRVPRGGPAVGISSVLNQLNKKNKLSVLDKSKLDWSTFKDEEGIEEEIQSHNKGKNGYLERRDFLERADARQYELERDLRLSRRSNR